ncbi:uncharacterized protein LOC132299613 [Cornus florida]|uniref:uncharacterized protein LOC132299613 n=1 Tax=Cornus florida TaxID=4283 RepID=UPI0028A0ACF4|nr:uncharacterized protein LOC132299613 [Cornus florida]
MEEEELETQSRTTNGGTHNLLRNPNNGETFTSQEHNCFDDIDSACSTPYVSAPSSPGRGPPLAGAGFFYSAPASPMHFMLSSSPNSPSNASEASGSGSFEFEFSARFASIGPASAGSMSSADELFLNGQIRPMKLSTHLQRPLEPLLDLEEAEKGDLETKTVTRGRDVIMRDRSYRRRIRSLSPLRSAAFQWLKSEEQEDEVNETNEIDRGFEDVEIKTTPLANPASSDETTPSSSSVPCSRSSSAGRSSKRWIFLKEFLYRSKSEGRNNGHKFWSSISFSPVKDKKLSNASSDSAAKDKTSAATTSSAMAESSSSPAPAASVETKKASKRPAVAGKVMNGVGRRRRVPSPSAHELHYTANRAQAEEMRKKTFLPYRQGLLGCLGFSSKSYGAMNGFARALNPVSSR